MSHKVFFLTPFSKRESYIQKFRVHINQLRQVYIKYKFLFALGESWETREVGKRGKLRTWILKNICVGKMNICTLLLS